MGKHDFRRILYCALCSCLVLILSACSVNDAKASSLRPVPESTQSARFDPDTPADRYHLHVAVLAHDALEGRAIGSDGIDMAAGYIAGQFAAAGLEPGGPDGSYFQEFTIEQTPEIGDDTALSAEGSGITIDPELELDFIPFGFSARDEFEGKVAFVGYGITNSNEEYDDYAGIDVEGRVVLMLRREPPDFDSGGHTRHARFDKKVALAAKHGATAVLIANQDPGEDGYDELMRFMLRDEYEIPSRPADCRRLPDYRRSSTRPGRTYRPG